MNSGRKIAEGGALLALYSILLFISIQIPFLGLIMFFFLPVPFILVTLKEKLSWAFGFMFVACLLSVLIGTILALPIAIMVGLIGITMGYYLKRDKSNVAMFVGTVLVLLVGLIAFYALSSWFLDINYIEESTEMARLSMDKSMEFMAGFGQNVTPEMKEQMNTSFEMVETLLPSLFVIMSMVLVVFFFWAAQPILKRFSDKSITGLSLKDIRLPKSVLWYYLLTMIIALFMNVETGGYIFMAVSNLIFILQFFMVLQGISLIFYWAHLKGITKALPIVLFVFAMVIPLFQTIVRMIGIIDLGFPLRETLENKKKKD